MSTLHIYQPQGAEVNEAAALVAAELMVHLGGVGYVGVDLCRTAPDRARIIRMAADNLAATKYTALWIHTGRTTPFLAASLDLVSLSHRRGNISVRRIPAADLVEISGLSVTTPERTAIDLLACGVQAAIPHVLELLRFGADPELLQRRARAVRGVPNISFIRSLLRQLVALPLASPVDSRLGSPASSAR